MSDQAESLRNLVRYGEPITGRRLKETQLIAVASGKGGVGKSNIVLNFALALQDMGQRIALIDGDLGFSNLEILLGVRPRYTLQDVFEGRVDLDASFTRVQKGVALLSGGSGTAVDDTDAQVHLARFADGLFKLDGQFDRMYIDFGGGFGKYTAEMMALCDEMLLVSTPEPTSLTDAYALLKMVIQTGSIPRLKLIVNRARSVIQAQEAGQKFAVVAQKFLHVELEMLGYVMEDEAVFRAVTNQVPLLLCEPQSIAAKCVMQLAKNSVRGAEKAAPARGIRAFFERFAKRK